MQNKNKVYFENLLSNIHRKKISISIIGLGYVGLPRALNFCEENILVHGIDLNKKKVNSLNKGTSYINHINSKRILNAVNSGYLKLSNNYSSVKTVDVIILSLPTPLNNDKEPDLSFIIKTISSIKKYLKKGQILILESTTYPGTTDEEIYPVLKELDFKVGEDFFLAYSPEREDPGNQIFSSKQVPKLLGGHTKECSEIGQKVYEITNENVIALSSIRTAEMTKLLENVYRAVNIGLVNELKELSDFLDIDIHEVIKAASTKPFGFQAFSPGPGVGGHCIPIDPYYLSWKAKDYNLDLKLIKTAGKINASMPNFVVKKIENILKKNRNLIVSYKVLVLGLTYKKNIDDIRESPSFEIMKALQNKGFKIFYNDPFISLELQKELLNKGLEFIEINKSNLSKFDFVILVTDHDDFNYQMIKENSKLIFDTRGKYKKSSNIIKA